MEQVDDRPDPDTDPDPVGAGGANAEEEEGGQALTRTVNQRLLDELREAAEREASGPSALSSSSSSKKKSKGGVANPFSGMASRKSDEERQASIEEARNLNGINPAVAIAGSVFALAVAAALWTVTNAVAESFATHPVQSDLYVVQRAAAVFRNVVMGLFALASGFFGVTGMGIFLLGIRVAVGVAKGELDPTPLPSAIKTQSADEEADRAQVLSNAWDLMTGGGGRGGRTGRRRNSNSKKDRDP